MRWKRNLLILAWIVAEVALLVVLVRSFGWLWVIAGWAVGFGIGLGLLGAATRGLADAAVPITPAGAPGGGAAGLTLAPGTLSTAARRFTSALLWLLPGFLSDIPALLLMLPIVGPALATSFRGVGERWLARRGYSTVVVADSTQESATIRRGDVITTEVISRSDDPRDDTSSGPGGSPDRGPRGRSTEHPTDGPTEGPAGHTGGSA